MTDDALSAPPPPQGWYPDPYGRHELRYWDGVRWGEHVSDHGRQSVDAVPEGTYLPRVKHDPAKIQEQVRAGGHRGAGLGPEASAAGTGSLFTEPVLVVNQKVKLIELQNEYAVFDANGTQVAAVRQVGQSAVKKALRLLGSVDQFLTHKLQVADLHGNVLLTLTRPAKIMKSTVIVGDGSGHEIGRIVQQNVIGKIHFAYEAGGQVVGHIRGENWRAWNWSLQDASGTEVGRITKTWEGLAKTMFTTADNYVVHIHRQLEEPLRSLVIASALGVDTALKQDNRGLG